VYEAIINIVSIEDVAVALIILEDSILSLTDSQVSCDLSGQAVILQTKSGIYYSLDAVGSRVWQLLQSDITLKELECTILEEYDVAPEYLKEDILKLIEDFHSQGLIEIHDAASA